MVYFFKVVTIYYFYSPKSLFMCSYLGLFQSFMSVNASDTLERTVPVKMSMRFILGQLQSPCGSGKVKISHQKDNRTKLMLYTQIYLWQGIDINTRA